MSTPYITPSMLTNLAPFGIDWGSIPIVGASPAANFAAVYDLCLVASGLCDVWCFAPLRAVTEVETLDGPDQRLTVRGSVGTALALMQHQPVVSVQGAQVVPSGAFPRNWSKIPSNMLALQEPSAAFQGPTSLGGSGSDGLNGIIIAPGYIDWTAGRFGFTVSIAYTNGWPVAGILPKATPTGTTQANSVSVINCSSIAGVSIGAPIVSYGNIPAGTTVANAVGSTITLSQNATVSTVGATLQVGYPPGATVLNVDDVTGFVGVNPAIYDAANLEFVSVTAAAATNPLTLLPEAAQVVCQVGVGTVTLATGTTFGHIGTSPPSVLISTLPDAVRMAAYYYAGAEALQRGATAITMQALPGSQSASGATSSAAFTAQAEKILGRAFTRVF